MIKYINIKTNFITTYIITTQIFQNKNLIAFRLHKESGVGRTQIFDLLLYTLINKKVILWQLNIWLVLDAYLFEII